MSLIPQSAHTKQASCQYLPPPAWNRVDWKCEGECFLGDDLHCLPDDFLWTIWANHLLLACLHRLVFFGTHLNNTRNASIHVSLFIPNPNPKLWMTLTLVTFTIVHIDLTTTPSLSACLDWEWIPNWPWLLKQIFSDLLRSVMSRVKVPLISAPASSSHSAHSNTWSQILFKQIQNKTNYWELYLRD